VAEIHLLAAEYAESDFANPPLLHPCSLGTLHNTSSPYQYFDVNIVNLQAQPTITVQFYILEVGPL